MTDIYSIEALLARGEFKCTCGKAHSTHLKAAVIEPGAINTVPDFIKSFGAGRAFLLADENTYAAAGAAVLGCIEAAGILCEKYIFSQKHVEPDEQSVGSAFLHFNASCDIIVGVGSGVINDIGKLLAKMTGLPYIIVGTAPSMDGYASGTSSVVRDGLKVSVDSVCPDVVIGDTDILCNAPMRTIRSGLGDMLAKYISICEWRIGSVVRGEYYCEEIARIIRAALKKCVESAPGIVKRDINAVRSVMEGMIISGIAADYAQISRPVSGVEHYFSHVWDMRSLEFGTPCDFHGIQCGIGTLLAIKAYDELKKVKPDRDKALANSQGFVAEEWFEELRGYIGKAAEAMIADERRAQKYSPENHASRLDNIIENWGEILRIINEELPAYNDIGLLLETVGAPLSPEEIGLPASQMALTFKSTKDIRDKYILSTLMWDLGVLDKAAEVIFG